MYFKYKKIYLCMDKRYMTDIQGLYNLDVHKYVKTKDGFDHYTSIDKLFN